jgi:CRP-like cAMP-binding protein
MRTRRFRPGETIISEGTEGDTAFLIVSGSVDVSVGHDARSKTVASLGAGEVFGEMCLIEPGPRSATIKASSETECIETSYEEFIAALQENPAQAVQLMRTLVRRLRQMNEQMAAISPFHLNAPDAGRLYNIGNALGFFGGLAAALTTPQTGAGQSATIWDRIFDYAAGNPSAIALTSATIVFFWSGLAYSRAWLNRSTLDVRLARLGDLLSAGGAILLGIGLLIIGNPALAASAGALHATGKLGSAVASSENLDPARWRTAVAGLSKDAVLVSRVPGVLAAISGLAATDLHAQLLSLNVLVCYLIWATADWMLLSRASLIKAATARVFA